MNQPQVNSRPERRALLASALETGLAGELPEWLRRGRIVVIYDSEVTPAWSATFETAAAEGERVVRFQILGQRAGLAEGVLGELQGDAIWHDALPGVRELLVGDSASVQSVNVERALARIWDGSFAIDLQRILEDRSYQVNSLGSTFCAQYGIDLGTGRPGFGIHNCLGALLRRYLVTTTNFRSLPQSQEDLLTTRVNDPGDGDRLGAVLFQLKNGLAADRARYDRVKQMFKSITGRGFEVTLEFTAERESSMSPRPDILVSGPNSVEIPLEFSGAGNFDILYAVTVLGGPPGSVACLDEPAAMLHPGTQQHLLRTISELAHHQVLLVTHSAAMIPAERISSVVRLHAGPGGETRVSRLPANLGAVIKSKLVRELQSVEARALLFANHVVLVEGDSEFGSLPMCYAKLYGRGPEGDGITFHPVGGKTNFATSMWLLSGFGIPFTVVCDGDAFPKRDFNERGNIVRQYCDVVGGSPPTSLTFVEQVAWAKERGILTLAKDPGWNLESVLDALQVEVPDEEAGTSKVRRAHFIVSSKEAPNAVCTMLDAVQKRALGFAEVNTGGAPT